MTFKQVVCRVGIWSEDGDRHWAQTGWSDHLADAAIRQSISAIDRQLAA